MEFVLRYYITYIVMNILKNRRRNTETWETPKKRRKESEIMPEIWTHEDKTAGWIRKQLERTLITIEN